MPALKKVLLCISSSKWGGGERHVLDLMTGLSAYYDLTLLLEPGGLLEEKARSQNLSIELHEFSRLPLTRSLPQLLAILQRIQPDGIHTHLNQASFQVALLRPLLACPILATVHGFSSLLYYSMPHHLIAVSEAVEIFLKPWFSKKVTKIYNGIEALTPTNTRFLQREIPRAFVFATIHPNKGQEFVTSSLNGSDLKVQITMIGRGRGDHEASLHKAIDKFSGAPNLEWKPMTGELDSFWNVADFIIIPSYKEALSYVAIEALSRGIPVLAAATGGLTEVFKHDEEGLFFAPGDPLSFRGALQEMIQKHNLYRRNLATQPFLGRHPQFQLDTMLQQTKTLYQKVFKLP